MLTKFTQIHNAPSRKVLKGHEKAVGQIRTPEKMTGVVFMIEAYSQMVVFLNGLASTLAVLIFGMAGMYSTRVENLHRTTPSDLLLERGSSIFLGEPGNSDRAIGCLKESCLDTYLSNLV